MNKMIIIIAMFLLVVPTASGEVRRTCINNDTLQINTSYVITEDSTESMINITEEKYCAYGCTGGKCEEMSNAMPLVLAGIGAAALFIILSLKVSDEHGALQALFMFMGLLLVGLTIGIANTIVQNIAAPSTAISLLDTATKVTTWVFYIAAVYFMIMFLWTVMKSLSPFGRKR